MARPLGAGSRGTNAVDRPVSALPNADGDALLDRVLADGAPTMLYQPLVDLTDPRLPAVGYEALARWPDLGGVSTGELFDRATTSDRMVELDWACRTAAIRGAMHAGLDRATALFVNVEPSASVAVPPPAAQRLWRQAAEQLTMVLEVTERRILTDPSALLTATAEARAAGWWIALDDLGANPDSLALLEFVRPDMVKLDLEFVQGDLDDDAVRTLRAVSAYCERTGALIVAEGIETEQHLERAAALGATFGQGYRFGRPGRLREGTRVFHANRVAPITGRSTPYEIVSGQRGYRVARRDMLMNLTDDIVHQVRNAPDPPVALVVVRTSSPIAAGRIDKWVEIGQRLPMVVLFGAGMDHDLGGDAHGAPLAGDDPLCDEWTLVIVGSHNALALAAQNVDGDDGPDCRYRYAMTQDRDLVIACGMSLLDRFVQSENARV